MGPTFGGGDEYGDDASNYGDDHDDDDGDADEGDGDDDDSETVMMAMPLKQMRHCRRDRCGIAAMKCGIAAKTNARK